MRMKEMIAAEEVTDSELLRQYQVEKNAQALNALFSKYLDVGFRTAMRYMRNPSDAEDVLQLAFLQFLEGLPNFRESATSAKPLLMKIIVNTCMEKLKEEKRRTNRQNKVASQKFQESHQPENLIESSSDKEVLKVKIKKMVDELPEKYRSPIWLVLYEGFTYPEVATVLDLPEKTVRTQVSRGLERLREILGSIGSILSIDAISALMLSSTLEGAPASAKKILESQKLSQSIKSKLLNPSQHSGRLPISKLGLSNFKLFTIMAVASFSVLAGYFINNHLKSAVPDSSISNIKKPSTNLETISVEETNQSWDFSNEKDRNLKVLMRNWEWSNKFNGMAGPENQLIMFSLPIKPQEKPFVLECLVLPTTVTYNGKINLYISAFWSLDQTMQEFELFPSSEKYVLDAGKLTTVKVYFYKNFICLFVDNKCIRIYKFPKIYINTTPGIASKNFIFRKITSRTLDIPPEQVLNAIKSVEGQKGQVQENWLINTDKIRFISE